MTTVGYGDAYPTTFGGRCVAVGMMVVGVGVFGSISALLASWILGDRNRDTDRDLKNEITEIRDHLERIESAVTSMNKIDPTH